MNLEVNRILHNLVKYEIIFQLPKTTEQLYRDHDPDFIDKFLILPPHQTEPIGYYYVSDFLGKRLDREGELVLDIGHYFIWGDVTWGDALENRPALIRIAESINENCNKLISKLH